MGNIFDAIKNFQGRNVIETKVTKKASQLPKTTVFKSIAKQGQVDTGVGKFKPIKIKAPPSVFDQPIKFFSGFDINRVFKRK